MAAIVLQSLRFAQFDNLRAAHTSPRQSHLAVDSRLAMLLQLRRSPKFWGRINAVKCSQRELGGYMGASVTVASGGSDAPVFGYGNLGHLANSSVICAHGETVVHAGLSLRRAYSSDSDFLPLTVDYRDRQYARGLIPTDKQARERHGTSDETLVGRMIDRAIRPLFPPGYVDDMQILVTCHAADGNYDPTVLGLNAASCSMLLSSAPWFGPIGCVRIGRIDGQLIVNPTLSQMKVSSLDLVYAGTLLRPVMLEASASEVPEAEIKRAMRLAHEAIQPIIKAQLELREKYVDDRQRKMDEVEIAVQSSSLGSVAPAPVTIGADGKVMELIKLTAGSKLEPMFRVSSALLAEAERLGLQAALDVFRASLPRSERSKREGGVRFAILNGLKENGDFSEEKPVAVQMAAEEVMCKAFRTVVLEGSRVDGRNQNAIRTIKSSIGVLPVTHGSSFFERGDTHVLCTTTLGSLYESPEKMNIYGSREVEKVNFMLHYDFPPYCTGVIEPIKLNRRMIGHGALAEKAVRAVMPPVESFPYLVRVFSECTSSNGSSSMASVCGASLALMDAGVPLKTAVAGVSVGMVSTDELRALDISPSSLEDDSGLYSSSVERALALDAGQDKYLLLTDILGMEDHYGDMDFKIAGSELGITAIQLDVKLRNGIPLRALEDAISASRVARLQILDKMKATIEIPNRNLKPQAPLAAMVKFDPERRRYLLGTSGEMMRYIQNTFQCELSIGDDAVDATEATAYIFGKNPILVQQAKSLVQDLVYSITVGENCTAVVSEVKDFGAIVKITRSQEALLHVSELTHDPELLKRPLTDLIAVGQRFQVQIIAVNNTTGQVRVSRKKLLPTPQGDSSFKDVLSPQPSTDLLLEPLPDFPVIPPRKFSKDYFRSNVASEKDIEAAIAKARPIISTDSNPIVPAKPISSEETVVKESESQTKEKTQASSKSDGGQVKEPNGTTRTQEQSHNGDRKKRHVPNNNKHRKSETSKDDPYRVDSMDAE